MSCEQCSTNVVKHARDAASAEVLLEYGDDAVAFRISDDTPPSSGNAPGADAGTDADNGLLGMRERVALFNGELHTGPTATGWVVTGELRAEGPAGETASRTAIPQQLQPTGSTGLNTPTEGSRPAWITSRACAGSALFRRRWWRGSGVPGCGTGVRSGRSR
jgi:hypothetical protein